MNHDTDKLILPIDDIRAAPIQSRSTAIYALAAPRDACRTPEVSIEALSPREAFVALVKGTFNRRLVSAQRLERQFGVMASLADRVIVKKLAIRGRSTGCRTSGADCARRSSSRG